MLENYVECAELCGKTIQALRIRNEAGNGAEIEIELTDGTRLSCSLTSQLSLKACLYRGGVGFPQVIREYEA